MPNVLIEESGKGTTQVTIRPRLRILRLLSVPVLLMGSWTFMALLALATMSSRLEFGEPLLPVWQALILIFLCSVVPVVLAVIMLTVAYTRETLVITDQVVWYRCSIFGIGRVRSTSREAVTIQLLPRQLLLHSSALACFGISRPRFRIRGLGRTRLIGGDLDDYGTAALSDLFRSKGFLR